MRVLFFSNNSESTLAAALSDLPTDPKFYTLVLTSDGSADTFSNRISSDGPTPLPGDDSKSVSGQLATLTHTSLPGRYEVVLLTKRHMLPDGFHVVRGLEISRDIYSPPAWPVGTKLQARVTAGTLQNFVQGDADLTARMDGRTMVLSVSSPPEPFGVDSAPSLLRTPRNPADAGNPYHVLGNGMPVVGASAFVDLGEPTVFRQPGGFNQGDVFVPATPDGYQYGVYSVAGKLRYLSGSDPAVVFPGDGGVIDVTSAAGDVLFHLVATPLPLNLIAARYNNALLVVDEVGFIAEQVTATTAPVVSVGYYDASSAPHPTHFANGVSLTQITGNQQIHRISAALNSALAQKLAFKLDTAATGGVFRGRFYWRGFLVQHFE